MLDPACRSLASGRCWGALVRPRILVVGDEPLIAAHVKRALAGEHDVVTVPAATFLLDGYSRGERFDAILLDLSMATLDGLVAYCGLVMAAPDQARRVVFLHPRGVDDPSRASIERLRQPMLTKPIDTVALRRAVEHILVAEWSHR